MPFLPKSIEPVDFQWKKKTDRVVSMHVEEGGRRLLLKTSSMLP